MESIVILPMHIHIHPRQSAISDMFLKATLVELYLVV